MEIKYLVANGTDDWAWLTDGHVDLEAFENACREQHPNAANTPPLHCWVKPTGLVGECGDALIDFCDENDEGARPVTAIVADEFWGCADALAA